MKSRKICRRSAYLIDSSNYISELKIIEKTKNLFATVDKTMISTEAINKSFIEYITKNCSLKNEELTMFTKLIDKLNYNAVQFIFAKIMTNANYALKPIYVLNKEDLNCPIYDALSYRNFLITADSNKFLYSSEDCLFELTINNNKLERTQQIFNHYGFHLIQTYKNYIVLATFHPKGNLIFLKKINANYQNITPQELNDVNSKFIDIQIDKLGNTIFVVLVMNNLIFYNMNDSSYANDIIINSHLYQSTLTIYYVLTAKYNNFMIIYGKNHTSNKIEAHIYKDNNQIDTLAIDGHEGQNKLVCSPQGDGLAIKNIDYNNKIIKYSIYKIDDNQLKEVYTTEKHYNIGIGCQNTNFIYSNNGKNIIVYNESNTMVSISANNEIKLFDIGCAIKYTFNESGYMLLAQQKDNQIRIYNFQRGIKEERTIICKDTNYTAKFSPNSQLVAVVENAYSPVTLLRIYKIMSVEPNGNITMLPRPKHVAQYSTTSAIQDFKFHPDGTKLIIGEVDKISILEISKVG